MKLETRSDFANLFEVKDKLAKVGELYRNVKDGALTLGYRRDTFVRETIIKADKKGEIHEDGFVFKVKIPPQASWTVTFDVEARGRRADIEDAENPRRSSAALDARLGQSLSEWIAAAPRPGGELGAAAPNLPPEPGRSGGAALRDGRGARRPAGGGPALVHGRFRARQPAHQLPGAGLRARARGGDAARAGRAAGAQESVPRRESPAKFPPGPFGEMTAFEDRPQSPYYRAADATMLFLILLEEYVRWTGDHALGKELEREARAAVDSIDNYGDRDKDGYVEYERRDPKTGLDNQCWKDSWDSIAFAGRHAGALAAGHLRAAGLRLQRQAPDRAPGAHIDMIRAAGRVRIIPHIPYAGDGTHGDIPQYNAVIDMLTATNGLLAGPDFYSYFDDELAGGLHLRLQRRAHDRQPAPERDRPAGDERALDDPDAAALSLTCPPVGLGSRLGGIGRRGHRVRR